MLCMMCYKKKERTPSLIPPRTFSVGSSSEISSCPALVYRLYLRLHTARRKALYSRGMFDLDAVAEPVASQ